MPLDDTDLRERVSSLEANQHNMLSQIGEIKDDIKWIRNMLSSGSKPTWGVLIMITFLTSLCVALITKALA